MQNTPFYVEAIEEMSSICRQIYPNAPWLTLDKFVQRSRRAKWVIVDIRPQSERAVSIIPGALSLDEFKARGKKRPGEYDGKSILIYCTAGCRSARYAMQLCESGFQAFNLYGGILAWALDGKSFATPNGETTRRVHVYSANWDTLPPGYEAVC